MKNIRNAVRVFLIVNNQVVCVKNKIKNEGYYDIPGGKIEKGETKEQAAVREFKEETGIDIKNPEYKGIMSIKYSDIDVNFSIFICKEFEGVPQYFSENDSMWIDIDKLLLERKRFQSTVMLSPKYINLLNGNNVFHIDINVGKTKESIERIDVKYINESR